MKCKPPTQMPPFFRDYIQGLPKEPAEALRDYYGSNENSLVETLNLVADVATGRLGRLKQKENSG